MNNYYVELEIDNNLGLEEITKILKKEKKKWLNRTNAPDLARRQEAERKMQLIQEAEEVFKDEQSRASYDKQLGANNNSNYSQNSTSTQNENYEGQNVDQVLEEAWNLIGKNDYANAIVLARQAVQMSPQYGYAWATLGRANECFNNHNEAIDAYKKAISLEPICAAYYCDLSGVLYDIGNFKDSEIYVDKAIYLDPNIDRSQVIKAYLLCKKDEYDKALEIGHNLLMKNPDNTWINNVVADLYYNKGISYCYKGQGEYIYNIDPEATKKMIECMQKAKTHSPNNENIDEKIAWGKKAFEKKFDTKKSGLFGIPAVMFILGLDSGTMIMLSLILAGIVTYLCFRPNWEFTKYEMTGQKTSLDFASVAGRGVLAAVLKFIGTVLKIIAETIKAIC